MKKQVLIILAVTIALVSCQKEVNVKEVSTALYEQMESDYEAAATIEEKEAIVEAGFKYTIKGDRDIDEIETQLPKPGVVMSEKSLAEVSLPIE